jgi:glutaminase
MMTAPRHDMQDQTRGSAARNPQGWGAAIAPLQRFIAACHSEFWHARDGAVADYIPELGKAEPEHFGISLATLDGHVYEVGDSRIPFTIQSMSKPFVFALALDTLGAATVEGAIGVEPSGDPFNSIRLNADNHPFNPMVNAGAITCSGLIREARGDTAFDCIRDALGRFAGRPLDVDDAVFGSESATGDRNRAIAYLLRTSHVVREDVEAVLAVYFRQCAIRVTARDTAIMAATLANRGVNPVTGEQVVTPYAVSRTLSVMTSSGMYDFAGEWIYRVGIPAKSGVGGGILASLPARLGLGSYSPRLDGHGNSVRGIKVCEALSSHYELHMLSRSDDARTAIIADYDIGANPSRRSRHAQEREILAQHPDSVRVLELIGTLSLSSVDYVSRRLADGARPQFVILDLRRVIAMTPAGLRLLAELFHELNDFHVTVVLSGIRRSSSDWRDITARTGDISNVRDFYLLDTAIEWAEDQIVYRYGGAIDFLETTELSEQPLLDGLAEAELIELAAFAHIRHYQQGVRIMAAGEPATSLFFLRSGVVHVTLPDGIRLATLTAGQAFGEMALIEPMRSADVSADFSATAFEIALADFDRFRHQHPKAGATIMRNLARLLADRLIVANARLNLLTAN